VLCCTHSPCILPLLQSAQDFAKVRLLPASTGLYRYTDTAVAAVVVLSGMPRGMRLKSGRAKAQAKKTTTAGLQVSHHLSIDSFAFFASMSLMLLLAARSSDCCYAAFSHRESVVAVCGLSHTAADYQLQYFVVQLVVVLK
jgi:hypothetical protein